MSGSITSLLMYPSRKPRFRYMNDIMMMVDFRCFGIWTRFRSIKIQRTPPRNKSHSRIIHILIRCTYHPYYPILLHPLTFMDSSLQFRGWLPFCESYQLRNASKKLETKTSTYHPPRRPKVYKVNAWVVVCP